jgi:hypothetical protein
MRSLASQAATPTRPLVLRLGRILQPGREYEKAEIAKLIMKDQGIAQATAYRWIDRAHASNR